MPQRASSERRPNAAQRKLFLAFTAFCLPWLVDAQQQQRQVLEQHPSAHLHPAINVAKDDGIAIENRKRPSAPRFRHESPFEGDRVVGKLAATTNTQNAASQSRGSSTIAPQKRSHDTPIPDDASALATLAPAQSVRAPNSPQHVPSLLAGGGLSSLRSARNLENWEVEDYILMATVDGHLYAADRESGDERWHLEVEQPVVETIHYRPNATFRDRDEKSQHPLDDYIWAIEPIHNGAVYVWTPSQYGSGLVSTGYTMKELVDDWGHYASSEPPVVYTGHKKNTLITVDAATGRVLKWFGQTGAQVDQSATCFPPNSKFVDTDNEECSNSGTITLSRTEYTVDIHHRNDGREIATLKYAEWGPNNFDNDLHQQYQATPDNRYYTSRHDGKVYALEYPSSASSFSVEFPVPVARIFDIGRPEDAPPGSNPELVLLPQPMPPFRDIESANTRRQSAFLNQTATGNWYVMSGASYPLVVDGPSAQIGRSKSWDSEVWLDNQRLPADLVGVHTLGNHRSTPDWPSSVPPSLPSEPWGSGKVVSSSDRDTVLPVVQDGETDLPPIVETVFTLPRRAIDSTMDLVTNPVSFFIALCAAYYYWRMKPRPSSKEYLNTPAFVQPTDPHNESQGQARSGDQGGIGRRITDEHDILPLGRHKSVSTAENASAMAEPESTVIHALPEQRNADSESPDEKKKARRGRRGGVKHRKGAKKQRDTSEAPAGTRSPELDDSIPGLLNVGLPPKLEPNVTTMTNDPEDVSGPIVKIGGIEVNQDCQLGMGSNGTVVFAGKFHGRDVAVKRMLTQFWDIATQETQLLLESDHHQNVIRYYAMSKNDSFLYIALELCQASLSDVVDRPHLFPQLAKAGELDLPRVLLQIAHGLSFLHDLRIVHRDLKPQNILVTMGRDGRPRLLVSDFGLCKKLEGGQSSFGATTAHAAGTSGWRAPELLLDDDAREGSTMSLASIHSDSSQLVSADLMPNRRATRSIDIFSLGLVFFYVLTKGLHPFDCGDRYMREVNIRKGQFNLKPLEILGDVAHEAKALIETMIRADPQSRPTAKDVMAHPFFWSAKEQLSFLCDVSDYFELEPRDPMSPALAELESYAPQVCRGDFLKVLPKEFVESLGKQRKYTGSRLLDLLRALRNKRFHYGDLNDNLKKMVGPVPDGYLGFWTRRFPNLLIVCCNVIYKLNLEELDTFQEYFKARIPS
ncbi:hypothetical protein GGR57DRAFT_282706 [Xylariaceae sp. FL1272]|nr:hypothetical protein GGR57DRAFT_282706 [Xylariaceae sp. FL1272]